MFSQFSDNAYGLRNFLLTLDGTANGFYMRFSQRKIYVLKSQVDAVLNSTGRLAHLTTQILSFCISTPIMDPD